VFPGGLLVPPWNGAFAFITLIQPEKIPNQRSILKFQTRTPYEYRRNSTTQGHHFNLSDASEFLKACEGHSRLLLTDKQTQHWPNQEIKTSGGSRGDFDIEFSEIYL
jgi:hypothetical protein